MKKLTFEDILFEILPLDALDIISASSAFDGEEDKIVEWVW